MSKKPQKEGKKGNSLHNYFPSNNHQEHKSTQQTIPKNQARKRLCPSTHHPQRNSPSPPASPKKHTIHSLAKTHTLETVIEKCPKLAELLTFIEGSISVPKKIVKSLIKKYLQSSVRALWSTKYSPNQCCELFNVKAGHKIRDWLSAFFEYKNKISEESDSFLNDFSEEPPCKAYQNIRENQWMLMALVVRGRPGTGKSSAVRAVAREMDIDLQQCGNHYNQTKYLKEKNESTQSESVKTAISRKIKLEKNAQMITKFMTPVQREKASENRKSQMIHNVGEIFPQAEAHKFYSQLSRCVQLSKIPFIMTDSCDKLPKECEKYDVIEYECGSNERIEEVLWAIYHIEHVLLLNNLVEIEEEGLFEAINQQIASIQPKQIASTHKIREVCTLFNYRLDYIFTFLQQHSLQTINLRPLFIQKYKNYTQQTFMQEISLLTFQQNGNLEETKHCSEKSEEAALTTQDSEQNEKGRQLDFEQHLRRLKIARVEEMMPGLEEGEKLFVGEWEQDSQNCIPIRIHRAVKKSLVAKINLEINSVSEKHKSTLRTSELQHLPMVIKEKRASRNAKASDDVYLKFFSQNQCIYLRQFGHLIKNQ